MSGPYERPDGTAERETPLDLLLNAIGNPADGSSSSATGQGNLVSGSSGYGLVDGAYDGMPTEGGLTDERVATVPIKADGHHAVEDQHVSHPFMRPQSQSMRKHK